MNVRQWWGGVRLRLRELVPALRGLLLAALAGAAMIALLYQTPAYHVVDIGGYDAAYVQGFHDAQCTTDIGGPRPYMAGSDGSVRWSRATSYLLLPQAGWPGQVSIRLRGWRANEQSLFPTVHVWLNGRDLLVTIQTSGEWETHSFPITGGLWKPSDVVVELRTTTTSLPGDDRRVGVLVDRVAYHVAPAATGVIVPYPAQLVYGAVAAALLWLTLRPTSPTAPQTAWQRRRRLSLFLIGCGLLGILFLVLYRLQPSLYPYPLRRLLPALNVALAVVLVWRYGPALVRRWPVVLDITAVVGIAVWLVAVLAAAQNHLTLSVPGVEKDFRVFATRTDSLEHILRADGFYNLGYPLLLWLVQPYTADNPFLAARLIAAVCGAVLLLSGYWLARTLAASPELHGRGESLALLTVLVLAFSPLVVQYALYVGSDMPFAALTALSLALMAAGSRHRPQDKQREALLLTALAGGAAGCAFLMRHLGLVLLPWGVLHCALLWRAPDANTTTPATSWLAVLRSRRFLISTLLFVGGFLLAAMPQIVVNTLQTGQPLYSHQAKNIWLAVYGDIDWGRWSEVPNTISLTEVVLRDPLRFLGNWWGNLVGFIGSGAEDTSATGRAVQLRLLAWPTNWLAVAGLVAWLVLALRSVLKASRTHISLVMFVGLYALAVSLAFILSRFFLPLTPLYAVAAAWVVCRSLPLSYRVVGSVLLLVLLWGGFGIGTRSVLDSQPADEVAVVRLTLATMQPGDTLLARLPAEVPLAKYSALAHTVVAWPDAPDEQAALALAQSQGVDYLLWDERGGAPPLPDVEAARVGGAGPYGLYQLGVVGVWTPSDLPGCDTLAGLAAF